MSELDAEIQSDEPEASTSPSAIVEPEPEAAPPLKRGRARA